MGRLDGKVALVTGASRGTGAVSARLLAEEGARVVLADVLDDLGKSVAEEIGAAASFVHLDVSDEAAWSDAVRSAEDQFGPITTLVNNAAILDVAAITETSSETFQRVLQVNLVGPFLGIRAVFPSMKTAGGGSVVNVASIDALESHNGIGAYASSKWGLRGLSRTAALELGRHAIRVNTVCAGPGNPEMSRPFVEAAIAKIRETGAPPAPLPPRSFHRAGAMEDVARAILFLASDESSFISGAELAVDGGHTAGKFYPLVTD